VTPVRDKLNINAEDGLEVAETPYAARALQESLRSGLSRLPEPRNDYEIVVPEDEAMEVQQQTTVSIEDQADVDARALADQKAKRKLPIFPFTENVWFNPTQSNDSLSTTYSRATTA